MQNKDYKTVSVTNFLWVFFERCGAQGVSMIVFIILARLLSPEDYGIVAIITVFTSIVSIFISSGVSSALIQKKDADDLDFSSMFYFNLAMCLALYVIMFFAAPFIADFYNAPELKNLTRVASLTLIIAGVKGVQSTYVAKKLIYKKYFFSTLGGTIGAAIVGISMAIYGFGPWALVIQGLLNNAIDTIILWITVKWRPKKMFSLSRLLEALKFGYKLCIVVIINRIYQSARDLIIGKLYSAKDLAFYNKGQTFPGIVGNNIDDAMNSVLFPVLSLEQDNIDTMKAMTRRIIKTSTYVMMPMLAGLAACSTSIITVLLTEKWLPCVFYMRIFCFTGAIAPIINTNNNVVKAMGKGNVLIKLEIISKLVGIIVLISTMFISVKAIALGLAISTLINQLLYTIPNRKLLNYGYMEQLKDIMPQVIMSILMMICVYFVEMIGLNEWITLIIQIPLGVLIYVAFSIMLKIDSFYYLLDILKNRTGKNRS